MTTRRAFLGTFGGGLVAASLTAEAHAADRIARIRWLRLNLAASDPRP